MRQTVRRRLRAALGPADLVELDEGRVRVLGRGLEPVRRAVEILAEERVPFVPVGDGRSVRASVEVQAPRGIFELWPEELVVRVGAGTSIEELDVGLAPHGLCLGVADGAERAGAIGALFAAGDRGLRGGVGEGLRERASASTLVDGTGTLRRSGARVVKSVAGYDLTRIHWGARGSLGLLLDLTLRVRARPAATAVVALPCTIVALPEVLARTRAVAQDACVELWVGAAAAAIAGLGEGPQLVLSREGSEVGIRAWVRALGGAALDAGSLSRLGAACWDRWAPVHRATGVTLRRLGACGAFAVHAVIDLLAAEAWWVGTLDEIPRVDGLAIWAENAAARTGREFDHDPVRTDTERRLRAVFDPHALLPQAPAPIAVLEAGGRR